jgi:hypothetical protein
MKFLVVVLILLSFTSYAQCIEKEKIMWGGNYIIPFCPAYQFTFDGDTSKHWSILDPMHISQVKDLITPVKNSVEQEVKNYAGESFFSRVEFQSVDIVYPDSIEKFKSRQPQVDWEKCKAKYYFYYKFFPDSIASYNIGIAVNEQGKIISQFKFPAKQDYVPIDTSLTVCRVVDIAMKANKDIVPIEEVKFDYDPKTKRFYWVISQEILNVREGENKYNQVIVDAANPKIVRTQVGKSHVVF